MAAPHRSTGPRTAAGKIRASRNALRHGLAASDRRRLVPAEAVERVARAICCNDQHPVLLEAAGRLAENEFILDAIRRQKIFVIERLRDATSIALRRGDNSLDLGKAHFLACWLCVHEIERQLPKVIEKYRDQLEAPLSYDLGPVPLSVFALLEEAEPTAEQQQELLEQARRAIEREGRTEYEALEDAIPDLIHLERYERRAWARQKRAMNEFLNLKFTRMLMERERRADAPISQEENNR